MKFQTKERKPILQKQYHVLVNFIGESKNSTQDELEGTIREFRGFEEMAFCYQNCSSDREKLLKFEAEGRELAIFLISLEQFIQTVKGQNNFW